MARSYNFRRGIDAAGHCPLSERLDDSSEAMMRVPPLSKIVWMLDRSEFGTYSVSSVAARPENVRYSLRTHTGSTHTVRKALMSAIVPWTGPNQNARHLYYPLWRGYRTWQGHATGVHLQ